MLIRQDDIEGDVAVEGVDKVTFTCQADAPSACSQWDQVCHYFSHLELHFMDNGVGHLCPYALFCDGVKVPTCVENCYLCYCWEGFVGLWCRWCRAAIAWLGCSTCVGGRHEVELKGEAGVGLSPLAWPCTLALLL